MDFATGAVVQLAHSTMLYALKDVAKLERGETLLVLGAEAALDSRRSNWES